MIVERNVGWRTIVYCNDARPEFVLSNTAV
jgi:hypothetical protein